MSCQRRQTIALTINYASINYSEPAFYLEDSEHFYLGKVYFLYDITLKNQTNDTISIHLDLSDDLKMESRLVLLNCNGNFIVNPYDSVLFVCRTNVKFSYVYDIDNIKKMIAKGDSLINVATIYGIYKCTRGCRNERDTLRVGRSLEFFVGSESLNRFENKNLLEQFWPEVIYRK